MLAVVHKRKRLGTPPTRSVFSTSAHNAALTHEHWWYQHCSLQFSD